MANDAGGREALVALGLRTVPVVAKGDRFVFGQSIRDVAQFLAISMDDSGPLPAPVLLERIQRVLTVASSLMPQFPEDRIAETLPGRNRSYLALGHHVFAVVEAFLITARGGRLESGMYDVPPPPGLTTGADVAAYGRGTAKELAEWWAGCDSDSPATILDTYYGDQPLHDVLERTAWHTAQHVRQLTWALERMGIAPADRLSDTDLHRLPVPEQVWDS